MNYDFNNNIKFSFQIYTEIPQTAAILSLLSPVICTILYVVLAVSQIIKIQFFYILTITSYWFNQYMPLTYTFPQYSEVPGNIIDSQINIQNSYYLLTNLLRYQIPTVLISLLAYKQYIISIIIGIIAFTGFFFNTIKFYVSISDNKFFSSSTAFNTLLIICQLILLLTGKEFRFKNKVYLIIVSIFYAFIILVLIVYRPILYNCNQSDPMIIIDSVFDIIIYGLICSIWYFIEFN